MTTTFLEIHIKINHVAKRLRFIYLILTVIFTSNIFLIGFTLSKTSLITSKSAKTSESVSWPTNLSGVLRLGRSSCSSIEGVKKSDRFAYGCRFDAFLMVNLYQLITSRSSTSSSSSVDNVIAASRTISKNFIA